MLFIMSFEFIMFIMSLELIMLFLSEQFENKNLANYFKYKKSLDTFKLIPLSLSLATQTYYLKSTTILNLCLIILGMFHQVKLT